MTANSDLLRTPLFDWHVAHGGRMVDFAGWSMPVQYTSIVEEHQATRAAAGLFDISHMGRLLLDGPDAGTFLDSLLTRAVADMKPSQIRYSLACNEAGGVLDDVLVYRPVIRDDQPIGYGMVVNASNRAKIVAWLEAHRGNRNVEIRDMTEAYAMIAVQGPQAIPLLDALTPSEITSLHYYTGEMMSITGVNCFVSRTGYTGEDGCEVICDSDKIEGIWVALVAAAEKVGGSAVGLAARDTLRLEAGMPLYGHELSEEINPVAAGLDFAVNLRDRTFVGKDAILAFRQDSHQPVRVGLQLSDRRVPREGCPILQGEEVVGQVTSGTFSPTFERPIAMGYVKQTATALGASIAVDIRGQQHAAKIVPLPFYERGT
jgi:aminomethyltransferase